jgi:hypothetical protein
MFNLVVSLSCLYFAKKDFEDGDNKLGWISLVISACNFSVFLAEYF